MSQSYPNSYPLDSDMDQLSQSILAPLAGPDDANVSASSSFAVPSTQMSSSQQSQFLPQTQVPSSQQSLYFHTQPYSASSSGYHSGHSTQEVPSVPTSTPGPSTGAIAPVPARGQFPAAAPATGAIPEGMVPQNPDPAFMPPPEPAQHVPGSSFLPLFSSANSEVFRQKKGRGGARGGAAAGGGGLTRGGRGATSSWRPNRVEQQNMENKKIRAENTELRDNIAWIRSQLANLPEVVQQEVSSALEQSEQPLLEEVCALRSTVEATLASNKAAVETMKPSVDAAKSSVENLVETVKSTVEDAVGRAVEDLQRSEAEGREDLKRSVEERIARIEALLFPKQDITKKVSNPSVERTPRRRDASLVGRLPSFAVSPIQKPRDKSLSLPLNSTTIAECDLGSASQDLLRTTLGNQEGNNNRSSAEDLFSSQAENNEVEANWRNLKSGGAAQSTQDTTSRRSFLLPRLPVKQEENKSKGKNKFFVSKNKSPTKRQLLDNIVIVSSDDEDSAEDQIFS